MAEIVLLFFVVSVVGFFALYWVISRETANPKVVDRETTEREARKIGGSGCSRGRSRERPGGRDRSRRSDGLDGDDEL